MITERDDEPSHDRTAMVWSLLVSLVFNAGVWALILWGVRERHLMPPERAREQEFIVSSSSLRIERRDVPLPAHKPAQTASVSRPRAQAHPRRVAVPHHEAKPQEISREVPRAASQPRAHANAQQTLQEQLAQQETMFEQEARQMNANRAPLSAATMDPNRSPSSIHAYQVDLPGLPRRTDDGEGYFTKLQSWHDRGMNCYYGRYDWDYPEGGTESANIPWPFCFSPERDPVAAGVRTFPFPLPLSGYRLPSGTILEPIEKRVYDSWIAHQ